MQDEPAPLGVFDSGLGGLSVLREIRKQIPEHTVFYFADQGHVPYGSRSLEEVRSFSIEITRFLVGLGAKVIVVACNTASAAALDHLRKIFPGIPFVGMEPAVKPAAEQTQSGFVGVLATPATFQGALYASVVERFAGGVTLLQDTCPGLVNQIEKGEITSDTTRAILEKALVPMLRKGIDTIVLGCTHYPFVIPLINEIVGPTVRVIDPAPAVARQAQRLVGLSQDVRSEKGGLSFFTSATRESLERLLPIYLGETGTVSEVSWENNRLMVPSS